MGVLNVTPDSFSDGGRYAGVEAARDHALALIGQGADIIDIGGESTRPGAPRVDVQEEMARVLPVLDALQDVLASGTVAISIDTSQPLLMRAALDRGASIINDVRSFSLPGALAAVQDRDCGLVIMHMQGEPGTMQQQPRYADVVAEVRDWLGRRRDALLEAGVAAGRIALDPGFGFGKAHGHNRELLAGLAPLAGLGHALLVGLSRKATLGDITGRPVGQRDAASLAAALIAVQKGARIVRVHDVAATRDALAVWEAVQASGPRGAVEGEAA